MLTEHAIAVMQAMENRGLETPMTATNLSDGEKKHAIEQNIRQIMTVLGLDLTDDSLMDTPKRIAKMYVDEIFFGLDYEKFPKITVIDNKMQVNETIKVSDISLTSTCEHHFVTIDGTAKVAYRPKDRIIGLSKINRLVDFFAQRPQVQERLTQQVMIALQVLAQTDDVAVSITATHFCVKARGIRDANSYTTTSSFGGVFKTDSFVRSEFFA